MDMLVKLYGLPSLEDEMRKMESKGIKIHRAFPPDRKKILELVEELTGPYARGEAECCFSRMAPTMYVASRGCELLGYACYDATAPDFFGPTQVRDEEQGKGIGKALLISCLHALRAEGYGYAIIGGIGPEKFYEKTVGAILIPGSDPSVYEDCVSWQPGKEE